MAPKKNTRAGSSQPTRQTRSTSREPVPQPPPRQKKGGRKRRHSDTSEASASSIPSTAAPTPSKRRKRGTVDVEHNVLEQVPEVIENDDEMVINAGDDAAESIEVSQSSQKHVHFGAQETDDEQVDHPTATVTPHPRKMTVKRRTTASPTLNGKGNITSHKRLSVRHSLPASFSQGSQDTVESTYDLAPCSEVVRSLMERRKEELEMSQGELDDDTKIEVFEDDEQDDLMVLASHKEIHYPTLPEDSAEFVSDGQLSKSSMSYSIKEGRLSLSQSQSRSQIEVSNEERESFKNAIVVLSQQASEARQKLEILEIEVAGLGFGDEGVDASSVLATIRNSFAMVRENVEHLLPDTIPEGASNGDLLEIITANNVEFANRLRLNDREISEQSSVIADFTNQVQGLLERLADAELRKQQLGERFTQVDKENDQKARLIENMEAEADEIDGERAELHEELESKNEAIQSLETEKGDLVVSLERLSVALQSYRDESERLSELITKMEEEYQTSIQKRDREREETVRELEDRLDQQVQLCTETEQANVGHQAMITSLELQKETLEQERESLQTELANVTIEREQERETREATEADLQEKTDQVEDLEARVDRLDEQVAELTAKIEELREVNQTERTQREAVENELDERNIEIDDINLRLQEQGKQANELRQKLFEVQQINERKVKDLELAASERDERYQEDIKMEVDRREAAEELAQDRDDMVKDLEAQIERIEEQMREQLTERDGHIEGLTTELEEKDGEISKLHADLKSAEQIYEVQVASSKAEREELEIVIAATRTEIAEREAQIEAMQQEAKAIEGHHNSEIDDRNAHIAELNHAVAEYRDQVDKLEREKQSLEHRVEREASEMLAMTNAKNEEIESLHNVILDKQEKIRIVEEKAVATDERWQEVLAAREEEITTLRTSESENSDAIAILTSNLQSIKRMFEEHIHRTNEKMARQEGDAAARLAQAEQDRAEMEGEGEHALSQMEQMEGFQFSFATASSKKTATQELVKKTGTSKRRVKDSGIGMSDGLEDETLIGL